MNKKIFWGILLIIFGLFYTLQEYISENVLRYFLNYQVVLFFVGLWFLATKKKTTGLSLVIIGIYLYLSEFFYDYFDLVFPIVIFVGGVGLIALGLHEKKLLTPEKLKKDFVFKSTKKKDKDKNVEDAEEIK